MPISNGSKIEHLFLIDKQFVNVYNLTLQHGKRYFLCITANETLKVYEKFRENLPAVSVCSDGATVDISPPRPGEVWIGEKGQKFQVGQP